MKTLFSCYAFPSKKILQQVSETNKKQKKQKTKLQQDFVINIISVESD